MFDLEVEMIELFNEKYPGKLSCKFVKGIEVIADFSGLNSDYNKIRNDVGLLPLTFTDYFKIPGDAGEELIDVLFTKSIEFLNYNQNRLGYFLNDSGEPTAMVTVYKNEDHLLVETFSWDTDNVKKLFELYQVEYQLLDLSGILLEGPKATDFMVNQLNLEVDYFVYQSHQEIEYSGQSILVARAGYCGEYGYKIIGGFDVINVMLLDMLHKYPEKFAGYDAFKLCQYEIKQPFWELPYLEVSSNIFETDYQWLIDFKKDIEFKGKNTLCQEKFANAKRWIIGAICDEQASAGDSVNLGDKKIGIVIECEYSLSLKRYITMLFLDKEYAHANLSLTTGSNIHMKTASAPYVLPTSWNVA
jgi:aminomethyltransferase